MLSFFRRMTKSVFGAIIAGLLLLLIVVGFAMSDLANIGTGFGGSGGSNLATVGGKPITDREMNDAMQRRLAQVRQQNPQADYSSIVGDFDEVLESLIEQRALTAFAEKHGFIISKRLIDAEIAQIPATRGLNGEFSQQAYLAFLNEQRMTDQQLRQLIAASLLERMILVPVASSARVPVGIATPYASLMLEQREGEAVTIPIAAFRAGLNPSDADIQAFYNSNRNRYMIPEQRAIRVARIGPEQVANVVPTDQEIAAYYNANRAAYAASDTRDIAQAVVPDRNAANAIAAKLRSGAPIAVAAGDAAVTLEDQTRAAYGSAAGNAAAAAVFGASSGAVVGPIQTEFGWLVAKVQSITSKPGRSLAQARSEIAARLTQEKRNQALEDLVTRVQDAIDEGSNFAEAVGAARLPVTTTPLITANGTSRTDPKYRVPPELAPAIAPGFQIAENDPPEIVSLPNDQGYAVVSPGQVVPAAPAPLASIRDQVRNDWIGMRALERARAAATAIAARAGRNVPLAQAVKEAGVALPPVRPLKVRRLEIASAGGQVPAPLRLLFTLGLGKSRPVPDTQGRGFFVVKVNKITPGNALFQPGLIPRMRNELQEATAQDYARQFLAAVRAEMKAKRNESAIAAAKRRLAGS